MLAQVPELEQAQEWALVLVLVPVLVPVLVLVLEQALVVAPAG